MGFRLAVALQWEQEQEKKREQVMRALYGGPRADIADSLRQSELWSSFTQAASKCLEAENEQESIQGIRPGVGFAKEGFRDDLDEATSCYLQDGRLWCDRVTARFVVWHLKCELYPLLRRIGLDLYPAWAGRPYQTIASGEWIGIPLTVALALVALIAGYVPWGLNAIADVISVEGLRPRNTAWTAWPILIVLGYLTVHLVTVAHLRRRLRYPFRLACERILYTLNEIGRSKSDGGIYDAEALIHRLRMCEADGFFVPSVVYRLLRMLADGGR
ncbi:hypothetical protein [uncultured Bosea sp.]|uniref:hypothetical protein n=1 Tax=uncultured Bosea sp. TaxID=211457 RepID=UPI0025DE2602|nr:hypothetical protein [uncultured Bosea sp.]